VEMWRHRNPLALSVIATNHPSSAVLLFESQYDTALICCWQHLNLTLLHISVLFFFQPFNEIVNTSYVYILIIAFLLLGVAFH
jgi:hypothetical protein